MRYKMGILAMLFGLSQNQQVFADTSNMTILDVRTPTEYSESHVQDSINVDILNSDFKSKVQKLDKAKTYKLYCRSGNRSGQAERLMKTMGFEDVENIGSLGQAIKRLNKPCKGSSC